MKAKRVACIAAVGLLAVLTISNGSSAQELNAKQAESFRGGVPQLGDNTLA